jgi:hypothetical protein
MRSRFSCASPSTLLAALEDASRSANSDRKDRARDSFAPEGVFSIDAGDASSEYQCC